jgi:SAM-dependent methyltransferase
MDNYQVSRRAVFGPYLNKASRGIEIGPGYRPTFAKSDGYSVVVIDHCSTADLIAKYDADSSIPKELVAQIEAVDIVWTGGSYSSLPGLSGAFDYVAASHVIEHATDVCGFLQDCSSLLKPGGHLLLAIPHRSCILDYYRPPSTLGDVLLAHVAPHAYDVKSRLDEAWYGALLDGGGAWSEAHRQLAAQAGRVPLPQHGPGLAQHVWATTVGGPLVPGPYRDAHRWVFDPSSFEEMAVFLELHAGTGLHLVSMPGVFECEFYAVLRKTAPPPGQASELERSRLGALSARHPRPVS